MHLVGVTGDVATALATWRSPDFAAKQLDERRALRFPPIVRLAAATGPSRAVDDLADVWTTQGASLLVRSPDPAGERIVARFAYAEGAAMAAAAKAALLRHGAARRPKPPAPPPPALRVHFDPHEF